MILEVIYEVSNEILIFFNPLPIIKKFWNEVSIMFSICNKVEEFCVRVAFLEHGNSRRLLL